MTHNPPPNNLDRDDRQVHMTSVEKIKGKFRGLQLWIRNATLIFLPAVFRAKLYAHVHNNLCK